MLKNKIAIITGSSRGIGNAIAEEYLKNGAKVVICGSKKENAEKAIEKFVEVGYDKEKMLAVGMNMTDNESIVSAVNEVIESWGKIDILVNNAGITDTFSLLESTDEKYFHVYDINVFGTLRITREVVKYMKDTGGSIINTASMVGISGSTNQTAYASSKAAIINLTICLAKELGGYNIRVNAVAPGVVGTDMVKENVSEQMMNYMINATPLKRMATPTDIAGAYVYLGSDASSFTTATTIQVDGGLKL